MIRSENEEQAGNPAPDDGLQMRCGKIPQFYTAFSGYL